MGNIATTSSHNLHAPCLSVQNLLICCFVGCSYFSVVLLAESSSNRTVQKFDIAELEECKKFCFGDFECRGFEFRAIRNSSDIAPCLLHHDPTYVDRRRPSLVAEQWVFTYRCPSSLGKVKRRREEWGKRKILIEE